MSMSKMYPKTAIPEPMEYCGITAPMALWNAVGLKIINWIGDEVEFPDASNTAYGGRQGATDGELIEARVTTGDTGEKALVWLIQERRRQAEESGRNRAASESAQAQKKAGDDAIHKARIERQAAELRCLANGIPQKAIDSRF